MAYKLEITKPVCHNCKAKAKWQIFNRYNASCGYFCTRCTNNEMKEMKQRENQNDQRAREQDAREKVWANPKMDNIN